MHAKKQGNNWVKIGTICTAVSLAVGFLFDFCPMNNAAALPTAFAILLTGCAIAWCYSAFIMLSKAKERLEFLPLATLIMIGGGLYSLLLCSGYFANL